MSLFLVYFELSGGSVPPLPPPPLVARPCALVLRPGTGPPSSGLLLTDGHSSERLLVYNNRVVGRQGEQMRASLLQYLRDRATARVLPHVVFVLAQGEMRELAISLETKRRIPVENLGAELPLMKPSELVEVVAPYFEGERHDVNRPGRPRRKRVERGVK